MAFCNFIISIWLLSYCYHLAAAGKNGAKKWMSLIFCASAFLKKWAMNFFTAHHH